MSKQGTNRGSESSHCSRHLDEDLAHLSDKDLFVKWQAGDNQAFKPLYDRYNNKFINIATAALWKGGDEADDIVQELWKVLIEKYDPSRGEFEHFALKVLRNKLYSYLRSIRPFIDPDPTQGPGDDDTSELKPYIEIFLDKKALNEFREQSPENKIVSEIVLRKLREGLQEKDRNLLDTMKETDCDQKKTAEMLGVPYATLRKRWERLKKNLQKLADSLKDWRQY